MIRHLRIACYGLIRYARFKSTTTPIVELKLENECEDYLERRRIPNWEAGLVQSDRVAQEAPREAPEGVLSLFKDVQLTREKREQLLTRFPEILTISKSKIEDLVLRLSHLNMKRSSIYEILLSYPEIFSFQFDSDIQPIISFFNELLNNQNSAVDLLSQCPVILTYSLELEIKPKTQYFQKLGLSSIDIKDIVLGYPSVLALSIERSIQPKIDYLKTRLPGLNIKAMILRFPGFLDMSLEAHIKEKIEYFLDELEVKGGQLAKYLPYFPQIFSCEIESNIKTKIELLCLKMGVVEGRGKKFRIVKGESLSFMSCVPLFGLSKLQLLERIEQLSHIVFKNSETMDYLFKNCTLLFGCSVETEELCQSAQILMQVLSSNRSSFLRVIIANPEILMTPSEELKKKVDKLQSQEEDMIIDKLMTDL